MHEVEIKHSSEQIDYQEALNLMETRVAEITNRSKQQLIWFLEHPPIYTAGTSANINELLTNELPLYQTGRGGKITYHGPGQRIIYLMLDIARLHAPIKPDLRKFIQDLEIWIIKSLAIIGVQAFTKEGMIGIWVSHQGLDKKIAAIGIRVKKWISLHGVAINISPNMKHYDGIIPCGISNFGVTSLKDMGIDISLAEFDKILEQQFSKIFL